MHILRAAPIALVIAASASSAQAAIEYPYCAIPAFGTSLDCSYATIEQCRAFVSGVGSYCQSNPRFHATAPAAAPAARRTRRR